MPELEAALTALEVAHKARGTRREADALDKEASTVVKAYIDATDGADLVDYEHKIVAVLQHRTASGTLDLARMAEDDPDLLVELALIGALKADIKAIDGRREFSGAIEYLVPGGTTTALLIQELK
jgi:hypothetical protein